MNMTLTLILFSVSFVFIALTEIKKAAANAKFITVLYCLIIGVTCFISLVFSQLDMVDVRTNFILTFLIISSVSIIYRYLYRQTSATKSNHGE